MKKLNKLFNILIVGCLLSYAAFFMFYKKTQPQPIQKADFASIDVDRVVNKYLQQTTQQMQVDLYKSNKAVNTALKQQITLTPKAAEISPADIPREKQIAKDNSTPADEINASLNQKILNERQDEAERQEYARQFIENARKGGYHVVLSPDMKVLSVTPLRKPTQQDDSVEDGPSY